MSFPAASGAATATAAAAVALSGLPSIGLSNTIHSEVAPCLPLPSLPVFFGATDQDLRLVNNPAMLNRVDVLAQAEKIAELLRHTDVSYLNLKDDAKGATDMYVEPLELIDEVLKFNPEAFEYNAAGPIKEQVSGRAAAEKKLSETSFPVTNQNQQDYNSTHNHHHENISSNDISMLSSKKLKLKKKGGNGISVGPNPAELQDAIIRGFCELLDDLCSKAELQSDDRDEAEWLPLPLSDLRLVVNEIMSIREKKLLHLVPAEVLVRLLNVLDHQIHRAEGLSIEECDTSDSELVSTIFTALESIHAALAVMAHTEMPKQIYKEEIIERILEFSRRQMTDVMCACDPLYRASHRPSENTAFEADDYEENDAEFGSASKKRRTSKTTKLRKSTSNRVSSVVNTILQKLCTVLGLLKDLLLIERLSDSCILQLVKSSITTFMVDNIQLLQLKAIALLCAIFYLYMQHRTYVIDEVVQLLWKLPYSKRAIRTYHLREEEQRQIQMVTALLIQLIHCSANFPDSLRQASSGNAVLEVSIDANYPTKCHEATTEACCLFWSRVLQRFASVKTQDASELKSIMENLVTDLLTTLNIPEYPASAPILEVLCVLLLQNAGPKSKDVSARSMAIDILGTIAARLKRDALVCSREKFWILQDLLGQDAATQHYPKDSCCVCLGGRTDNLFTCHGCQRLFHADCLGIKEHEVSSRNLSCQTCICHKQLLVLRSFCNSQFKDDVSKKHNASKDDSKISQHEIVQQLILNHLQDVTSADDLHLFICWFYLCLWFKDDPNCQQKSTYYFARMKSRIIVRDSGTVSSMLTRDSIKKITLALGQKSSFCRGFDKILHVLLASLRENSPVIRAKALRAVSIIVEADPEVLGDKRVQSAVEGRFCDSAISVREAALELVGRHIASHPDVGFKYFEKIAERIKDTGVSVRKRAIKIIRDMCSSNANFSGFTQACTEIISRVSDDESSIQDLVCKTFYEFWFEEPPVSQTQVFGHGSTVPLEVAKKTEQIVEMLRRMPNSQLLVTVIKRNLSLDFLPQSAKAVGVNPVSLTTVRKRCELMCKCLLEKILQVEEMNSDEVEVHALPYVLVLHAFCLVDPTLCAPASNPSQFVVTLQPYLKTQVDNRMVAQLLESIIFIIDAVLPMVRKLPPSIVEELEQDLKQMILRHSFLTVVHACIKCLCSVSMMAGKGAAVVEQLVLGFFKFLDTQTVDNKQQVGRSLFCLGLLIRYGNCLLASCSNKVIDVRKSLTFFIKYLSVEDFVVKVRSLQALGFVLIARPEYMLESDIGKILEETFSSTADARLKIQALQSMFEYLLDAESKMGKDKADDNVAGYSVGAGRTVPVAAGAGDTNICGGIIQLYWDNILGRCLDSMEQVRQSALKIVEVVLRQGLVHPITCVPYLIALETDPLESNAKLAHHLLMNMHEKYPAFFESRLGDGLQMSFIFMQTISACSENVNHKIQCKTPVSGKGKPEAGSLTRLGVSRIYKLIRGDRMSRNKFMSSIVRKFDNPNWNNSVIAFLTYCAEVLALLPFVSPDEPLYLIYAINRIVQIRAGPLEANFKAWSSSLSRNESHSTPYGNGVYQEGTHEPTVTAQWMSMDLNGTFQQNIDGKPNFDDMRSVDLNGTVHQEPDDPSSNNGSSEAKLYATVSTDSFAFSKDNLERVQADCLSAIALQLLLKLKRHLKIMYSLDDARCQAYTPNELPKPGDVLSRQNIAFNIGETQFSLPTNPQEFIQSYQEFKRALRDDTMDYSLYSANIKRKRPTPRKSRKSGYMAGGDFDDDEDDEEWGSGMRKINASGGRRSSLRSSTRQY